MAQRSFRDSFLKSNLGTGHFETTTCLNVGDRLQFQLLLGRPWQRENLVSIDERDTGTFLVFRNKLDPEQIWELPVPECVPRSQGFPFEIRTSPKVLHCTLGSVADNSSLSSYYNSESPAPTSATAPESETNFFDNTNEPKSDLKMQLTIHASSTPHSPSSNINEEQHLLLLEETQNNITATITSCNGVQCLSFPAENQVQTAISSLRPDGVKSLSFPADSLVQPLPELSEWKGTIPTSKLIDGEIYHSQTNSQINEPHNSDIIGKGEIDRGNTKEGKVKE